MAASLAIYLKARELYELSYHQGIKYFGYTFLFFGISFFARPLGFLLMSLADLRIAIFRHALNFVLVYTGTMAALSLLYSVLWKKFENVSFNPFYLLNVLAVIIAGATLLGRTRFYILILQAVLFTAGMLLGYAEYIKAQKPEKHVSLFILYLLLFFSWIANVAAFFAIRISITAGLALKLFSTSLFLIILYRVLKITHSA